MGVTAALKLRQVSRNLENILAIELFCASQGIDFRRQRIGADKKLGKGTKPIYDQIRSAVPFIREDTYMKPHLNAVAAIVSGFVESR